jgi:hypothetical protein
MFGSYVFVVAIVVLILYLLIRATRGENKSAERDLLQRCMGDKSQVDRLIALEQRRNNGLSREQAALAAIQSHRRDNR